MKIIFSMESILMLFLFLIKGASSCKSSCVATMGGGFSSALTANCVSDDFQTTKCCNVYDKSCINQYRWCSKGQTSWDYVKLTCPAQDCPNSNNVIHHKHSKFGNRVQHTREWGWDFWLDGYYCRMIIEAEATLNGKILLEVIEKSYQKITIYQMPKNFHNDKYQGIFPNNQIFKEVKKGDQFAVPTDWYFMVLFEVDYDKMYGPMKIILKSWVSEYTTHDIDAIQNAWQPTATEYISPEERRRREEEKQRQI